MKIRCKCGRVLSVSMAKHAGKKVACKECGQRYRLPPAKSKNKTVMAKAWKPEKEDAQPLEPAEVGAELLGQKISFSWVLIGTLVTLAISIGGAYGVKVGLPRLMQNPDVAKIAPYLSLAVMWGPLLAFVFSGWLTARLSPGKTIAEPALGAAIAVAVMVTLFLTRPGPVAVWLEDIPRITVQGNMKDQIPFLANVFTMAVFTASMLACAGAYFGEVAQDRAKV